MRLPIDQTLYFVEQDFGKLGRAFVEIDRDRNSRQSVIEDIASGEYKDVVTVLEVNPIERICRDVTDSIFNEVHFEREMSECTRIADAFDHARDLRKHEAA